MPWTVSEGTGDGRGTARPARPVRHRPGQAGRQAFGAADEGAHAAGATGAVGFAGMGEVDIRNKLVEWEARLGPEHPSLAGVTDSLAALLEGEGRWREAEALHRRTLALQESACGPEHANVAAALERVVACLCHSDALGDADALMRRAIQIRKAGASERKTAQCLELFARVKSAQGEHAAAVAHLQAALDMQPALPQSQHKGGVGLEVPGLLLRLAEGLRKDGRTRQALDAAARAVAALRGCHPLPSAQLAEALSLQALLFTSLSQSEEAERALREVLRLTTELHGPQHVETAEAAGRLALALATQGGKADEAEARFQQAIDVLEGHAGVLPSRLAHVFKGYADLLAQTGRDEDAELLYRHCVNLLRRSPGEAASPHLGSVVNRLGALLVKLHRLPEAEAQLEEAMRLSEATHGARHHKTAVAYENLANAIVQLPKREPDAINLYQKSVSIKEALVQARALPHEQLAEALSLLGILLKQCDRYAEGERYCMRASEVRRQQLDPDQLELEDFLRSGDIAPSGAVGTPPSAADTGARDALAGSTDSLPSPRVEAIQGAMHAGDRNQRPGFQARDRGDLVQKSLEFREWAATSCHLEEALSQVRGSLTGDGSNGQPSHQKESPGDHSLAKRSSASTQRSVNGAPAAPEGAPHHRRPPVPHPIHMLREAAKAQHAPEAPIRPAAVAEEGANLCRYPSFDLEDSMVLDLEEPLTRSTFTSLAGRSHGNGFSMEDTDDDVLMGSILGLTMGAEDEGWDSSWANSGRIPARMLLGPGAGAQAGGLRHRAAANVADGATPPRRHVAGGGARQRPSEEGSVAVDELLQSFIGGSRFSEQNLGDSMDGLDSFLKQVRDNPSARSKRSLAAEAADLVPLKRDGRQHSLNVDELISSIYDDEGRDELCAQP